MDIRDGFSPRMLAPIGLAVFSVAFVLVIAVPLLGGGTGSTGDPEQASDRDTSSAAERRAERRAVRARRERREAGSSSSTYAIEPGDTLGAISQETGVDVATLEELNPGIDSQALVTGQMIKLRE